MGVTPTSSVSWIKPWPRWRPGSASSRPKSAWSRPGRPRPRQSWASSRPKSTRSRPKSAWSRPDRPRPRQSWASSRPDWGKCKSPCRAGWTSSTRCSSRAPSRSSLLLLSGPTSNVGIHLLWWPVHPKWVQQNASTTYGQTVLSWFASDVVDATVLIAFLGDLFVRKWAIVQLTVKIQLMIVSPNRSAEVIVDSWRLFVEDVCVRLRRCRGERWRRAKNEREQMLVSIRSRSFVRLFDDRWSSTFFLSSSESKACIYIYGENKRTGEQKRKKGEER